MTIRIGNGAGFLGDWLDAPRQVAAAGVDYLTLEYLAELTLSILARQREKDPRAGFARDFLDVLSTVLPWMQGAWPLRVVTNAGGVNPTACAVHAAKALTAAGLGSLPIGVCSGDDLLARLTELRAAGCEFVNLDTGQPLSALAAPIVCANAYLGAGAIARALDDGARIVITGRVADASLTVGPAVHEFGWAPDDYERLATASVAGHVIECGAQATGAFWQNSAEVDLTNVGYPIAELDAAGDCVITKPDGTGGCVNRETVAAQLVYEIGDPAHYLTPDVDVDFTQLRLAELGADRVRISGAVGREPPANLKVSLAYHAGYTASAQLLVYGVDCVAKAERCAAIVFGRLRQAGYEFADHAVELLGAGCGVPGVSALPAGLREVMLRLTVSDPRRAAVERFARELVPLATSGPAGLAGYTLARGTVRPQFAYWPTLVPRQFVAARHELRTAAEWAREESS